MKFIHLLFAASTAIASAVHAQPAAAPEGGHDAHHAEPASTATAGSPTSDGEVRKVDQEQGKITLRHGPIRNLEMPGMTMVFKVADPKLLDTLKEGDKVRFAAERVDGAITVTRIETVR